jgi:hypothetical protein
MMKLKCIEAETEEINGNAQWMGQLQTAMLHLSLYKTMDIFMSNKETPGHNNVGKFHNTMMNKRLTCALKHTVI